MSKSDQPSSSCQTDTVCPYVCYAGIGGNTAREFEGGGCGCEKDWNHFDLEWQTYAGWPETHSILEAEAALALAHGELDRAARCVGQLLGKYEKRKPQHFKPGGLYLRARVELAAGNKENAHQALCDALATSDEIGARRDVWGMCWALSQLEMERGNELAAIQMKERACMEVKLIADHAGTPELREVFVSRPDVRLVLGADRLSIPIS